MDDGTVYWTIPGPPRQPQAVPDRLPTGIPYRIAATRTNIRLTGKDPRIPPLDPKEWTPEQRAYAESWESGT